MEEFTNLGILDGQRVPPLLKENIQLTIHLRYSQTDPKQTKIILPILCWFV